MTPDDLPDVNRVERRCFSNPWPISAYRRELRLPEQNAYFVLRTFPDREPVASVNGENGHHRPVPLGGATRNLVRFPLLPFGRRQEAAGGEEVIIGFAGMWIMYDEAHVTTIGVDPAYRGRGYGEWLLMTLFDEAIRRGAAIMTLEVRVSNTSAQSLYRKYGFTVQGTRKRYYSDNDEDAYIMWSRSLHDDEYRAELADLATQLHRRLAAEIQPATPSGGA